MIRLVMADLEANGKIYRTGEMRQQIPFRYLQTVPKVRHQFRGSPWPSRSVARLPFAIICASSASSRSTHKAVKVGSF
jgi:hypothetical protein